jgi:hypothetical protein
VCLGVPPQWSCPPPAPWPCPRCGRTREDLTETPNLTRELPTRTRGFCREWREFYRRRQQVSIGSNHFIACRCWWGPQRYFIVYTVSSVSATITHSRVHTHDTNAPAISKESIRLYRRAIRMKKENGSKTHAENKQGKSRNTAGAASARARKRNILIGETGENGGKFYNTHRPKTTDQTIQVMSMADMASAAPELRSDDVESLLLSPSSLASAGDRWS